MSGRFTENGRYEIIEPYSYDDTSVGRRSRPSAKEIELAASSTEVEMFHSKFEVIPSGEKGRFFTVGLGGCTAVGLIAQEPSGARAVFLQHADPFQMTFRDRGGVSLPGVDAQSGKAIVMAEGYGAPVALSEVGANPPHLEQADAVYDIAHRLGQMVGADNVSIVPYMADDRTEANPYANSLVVDVPEVGAGSFLADGYFRA